MFSGNLITITSIVYASGFEYAGGFLDKLDIQCINNDIFIRFYNQQIAGWESERFIRRGDFQSITGLDQFGQRTKFAVKAASITPLPPIVSFQAFTQ